METYQASSGPNKTFVFILGLAIGAVILGAGIYVYSNFFASENANESEFTVTPTKEFALSVATPPEAETVSTDKVKISGGTGIASLVVINGGLEDTIVEATNGTFSVDYVLSLGENQIIVTAYDEASGDSRVKTINVLYLNENLENL